jgi:hypothetical protein
VQNKIQRRSFAWFKPPPVGARKSALFSAHASFIIGHLTDNLQFWLAHSLKFLSHKNFVNYK